MTGKLIYLMGPSGSGKDSLLQAARESPTLRGCHIVRQVITRSAEAVREDTQAVTPAQFDTLERTSVFAMSWRANGLCYGIPVQVDEWLTQGYDVLVNGSRGYLVQAHQCYPNLLMVLLGMKPEVLRQRLLARGRESPEKVGARPTRNVEFATSLEGPLFQLDNSDNLDDVLRSLLARLGSDRAYA